MPLFNGNSYLRQVNVVNGKGDVFTRCLSVCLSVCTVASQRLTRHDAVTVMTNDVTTSSADCALSVTSPAIVNTG